MRNTRLPEDRSGSPSTGVGTEILLEAAAMKLDFHSIPEQIIPRFKGGEEPLEFFAVVPTVKP